jgi:hypothetical protein
MEPAEINTDAALQSLATDGYLAFGNICVHLSFYLCLSAVCFGLPSAGGPLA